MTGIGQQGQRVGGQAGGHLDDQDDGTQGEGCGDPPPVVSCRAAMRHQVRVVGRAVSTRSVDGPNGRWYGDPAIPAARFGPFDLLRRYGGSRWRSLTGYRERGKDEWASLQPDFLVISHRTDGTLGASIVDPHATTSKASIEEPDQSSSLGTSSSWPSFFQSSSPSLKRCRAGHLPRGQPGSGRSMDSRGPGIATGRGLPEGSPPKAQFQGHRRLQPPGPG